MEENEINDFINTYQHEFFEILEEFFTKATGKPVNKFAPINGFAGSIYKLGELFKNNKKKHIESLKAYNILEEKIKKINYATEELFQELKRKPTTADISKKLGFKENDVNFLKSINDKIYLNTKL